MLQFAELLTPGVAPTDNLTKRVTFVLADMDVRVAWVWPNNSLRQGVTVCHSSLVKRVCTQDFI